MSAPQPVDLEQTFRRYLPEVEGEIAELLAGRDLPFYEMMRYHLGWSDAGGQPGPSAGGKKLRSTLCLLSCEAVGGDYRVALPAAAALELLHNFSLVHDDIEDGSPERRHRPTVWRIWGQPHAINVGDGMHVLAHLALWWLSQRGVPPERVLRAARLLDKTSLCLCEGQFRDLDYEGRLDIGVDEYLSMIGSKTASLMGAAMELGALLGAAEEVTVERYRRCGQKLGLAFQIRDDYLGIWGEERTTGKSSASDIEKRKKTFPIVYALERARGADGARLQRIYAKKRLSPQDLQTVLRILEGLGAREETRALARHYCAKAVEELEGLGEPSLALGELRALALFLVEREY